MSAASEVLARRLAAAESALESAAGGRSLCDLSRAGAPGGVKEREGRVAVLLEVRRTARREPSRSLLSIVDGARAAWEGQLVLAEERMGPAWVAYRRGGVAELEALAAELATEASPG